MVTGGCSLGAVTKTHAILKTNNVLLENWGGGRLLFLCGAIWGDRVRNFHFEKKQLRHGNHDCQ